MIYKVKKDCILYGLYLKELQSCFEFDDKLKRFCQFNGVSKSDVTTKVSDKNGTLELSVSIKTKGKANLVKRENGVEFQDGRKGSKKVSYDFSGVKLEDLPIAPRKHRGSNINKFILPEVAEKLRVPLNYEYFWILDKLYIEIADVKEELKFKMLGIERASELEEKVISHLRYAAEDILDY